MVASGQIWTSHVTLDSIALRVTEVPITLPDPTAYKNVELSGLLPDMEGPAVKRFVRGLRISQSSMVKSDQARVDPDNFLRASCAKTRAKGYAASR